MHTQTLLRDSAPTFFADRTAIPTDATLRIGIVDDHAIVRKGLREYYAQQLDCEVVGEASDGRQALALVRSVPIDVLVMDLAMPGQSGLEAVASVRAAAPKLKILVFSGHAESSYGFNVLRSGVHGFLGKDCDPDEIGTATRAVASGRRYASTATQARLASTAHALALHHRLTARELQVFLKLAEGATPAQISRALEVTTKTVSAHRSVILRKFAMTTNTQLTYYALKAGLLGGPVSSLS